MQASKERTLTEKIIIWNEQNWKPQLFCFIAIHGNWHVNNVVSTKNLNICTCTCLIHVYTFTKYIKILNSNEKLLETPRKIKVFKKVNLPICDYDDNGNLLRRQIFTGNVQKKLMSRGIILNLHLWKHRTYETGVLKTDILCWPYNK